jgi:3-hydroxy-9,10-secoandrosta-1,3,5(10)-triene-9,17-dione monooxygenase
MGLALNTREDTIPAADLLVRAHTLADEIRARAVEIDGVNKLPDDIVRRFIDLELVSALVPLRFGGHEANLETASRIIGIVAQANVAAAWVLAFYIGHNWIHCQFPEQAQKEIFANGPSPCSAGVLGPTLRIQIVDGGYRVKGRNGWNSGSPHADWILGAGMAFDGDTPKGPLCIIVPAGDVEIIDTWDVEAMRATGSWDVVYDDVFVPAHRGIGAMGLMSGDTPGAKLHENPLYSRPLTLITFIYCLSVFAGAVRGVTDDFCANTRERLGTNDKKAAKDKPSAHMRVGRGEAHAAMVDALMNDMIRVAESPDSATMDLAGRLAFKARTAALVDFCKDTINDLVLGAGANAFRQASPLHMAFRNINMISVHAFFDYDASMEAYGRSLLGLDPNTFV